MNIVLDYDETYTADKELWDSFISLLKEKNHTIICCTFRFSHMDNFDVERDMNKHSIPIVYAAHFNNKWEALVENGYNPENFIWIDDSPHLITLEGKIFDFT